MVLKLIIYEYMSQNKIESASNIDGISRKESAIH